MKLEDIFDFTIVGHNKPSAQKSKPYYTKVLRGEKKLKFKIVLMSPMDFLKNSFRYYDLNEKIVNVKLPRKLALPYIFITEQKSMGQGRAFWCLKNKIKKIPVFLVAVEDKEIDDFLRKRKIRSKLWVN